MSRRCERKRQENVFCEDDWVHITLGEFSDFGDWGPESEVVISASEMKEAAAALKEAQAKSPPKDYVMIVPPEFVDIALDILTDPGDTTDTTDILKKE